MENTFESASAGQVTAGWLAPLLNETSAQGIASSVNRLIKDGAIEAGSQLPTVRALAVRLGVSPATVSAAWNLLRKQRIIEGSGRQGTWVLKTPAHLVPTRFETIRPYWRSGVLDLTLACPDPALLPDIPRAMANAEADPHLNHYDRPRITENLRSAAEANWPWTPGGWLAVNGGYEGLLLLLSAWVVPGDYVAVADPSAPRILDILEHVGARVLPVTTDGSGPLPDKLSTALEHDPVAFVYEPRASSRMGVSVTPERRDQLAAVVGEAKLLIIEDDGLGELASAPYQGLGTLFPDQSVLVRSYSKSHGPDLRLGIMGGCKEAIARAMDYRQYGSGWTSRVMQNALAWMLEDPGTRASVEKAKSIYAQRRTGMAALLTERGVDCESQDGLSLAVPVLNEQQALLVLASHGIASIGGSNGSIRAHAPWVRLVTSLEFEDPESIAEAYAKAAKAI